MSTDQSQTAAKPVGWWESNNDIYDSTRANDEFRPTIQLNNKLTRADGSVEVRHGDTVMLCTINGPMSGERGKQLEDRAYIEVNLHLVRPQPSTVAYELMEQMYNQDTQDVFLKENIIQLGKHVLDVKQYPRQKIVISYEIINTDGSLLSTCANAFMQCVINSGIAAKSTFMSFTIAKILHNNEIFYKFDPTLADEAYSQGLITMTIENPTYVHDFKSGESVEKVKYLLQVLKSLQRSPQKIMNEGDENDDGDDKKMKKITTQQYNEMKAKVNEEPQIVQYITQKQWNSIELQHAMGLIVEKWIELSAKLRE